MTTYDLIINTLNCLLLIYLILKIKRVDSEISISTGPIIDKETRKSLLKPFAKAAKKKKPKVNDDNEAYRMEIDG